MAEMVSSSIVRDRYRTPMRFPVLRTLTAAMCMSAAGLLESCGGISGSVDTPRPDFVLSESPTTVTIQIGGTGSQVSVAVQPVNAYSGMVTVSISGLPTGVTAAPASFNVAAGSSQSVTLAASSSAAATTAGATFTGTGNGMTHTSTLQLVVKAAAPPPTSAPDVTTFHDDNARDGLNAQETTLTLTNVNSTQFGRVGFDATDGLVDAEPLYLANLNAGGSLRNVLFVATEHDSVYAFDADTGAQIWKTSVLGSGEATSDDRGCNQVTPEIGVTATPVIDRKQGTNGTIFVVAMSKDASGNYHQRLHALDATTGSEMTGSPTEIAATYPGMGANSSNGNVVFNPGQYKERAALLLVNGNVYLGFSSHCDIEPYTGWVMAYTESTLQQVQVLNLTPNGNDGSVWMSGDGIAADGAGNLFLLDANGTFDVALDANGFPVSADYGNAVLKLTSEGKLAVTDYFEPFNTVAESNADEDRKRAAIPL